MLTGSALCQLSAVQTSQDLTRGIPYWCEVARRRTGELLPREWSSSVQYVPGPAETSPRAPYPGSVHPSTPGHALPGGSTYDRMVLYVRLPSTPWPDGPTTQEAKRVPHPSFIFLTVTTTQPVLRFFLLSTVLGWKKGGGGR